MGVSDTETLAFVRQRLEALVERRLQGFSAAERREYERLIEREAALIQQRERATSGPR